MQWSENSTVIVEVGDIKRFSDVIGRHTVRLADTPQCRQAIAGRLQVAGCPVDLSTNGWEEVGDFSAAIQKATETLAGNVYGELPLETSTDAVALLARAQTDGIQHPFTKVETPHGTLIASDLFLLGAGEDPKENHRWLTALNWLLSHGLVESIGPDAAGDRFEITPMGHAFLNEHGPN